MHGQTCFRYLSQEVLIATVVKKEMCSESFYIPPAGCAISVDVCAGYQNDNYRLFKLTFFNFAGKSGGIQRLRPRPTLVSF